MRICQRHLSKRTQKFRRLGSVLGSSRRGSTLCNTKRPDATAEDVMHHTQQRLHLGYLSAIFTDA